MIQQTPSVVSLPAPLGADFPPVIGVDGLSALLDKSPATIFADRSRAPHKIPPACVAPGSKSPRWVTADVVAWLRQHQEAATPAPEKPAGPRRVGRPTKAEQKRREEKRSEAAAAKEGGAA